MTDKEIKRRLEIEKAASYATGILDEEEWFIKGAQWADEHPNIDAFIEKACEGIEHLLSGYIIRNFHFGDSYEMDKLIEDFRRQMEE